MNYLKEIFLGTPVLVIVLLKASTNQLSMRQFLPPRPSPNGSMAAVLGCSLPRSHARLKGLPLQHVRRASESLAVQNTPARGSKRFRLRLSHREGGVRIPAEADRRGLGAAPRAPLRAQPRSVKG